MKAVVRFLACVTWSIAATYGMLHVPFGGTAVGFLIWQAVTLTVLVAGWWFIVKEAWVVAAPVSLVIGLSVGWGLIELSLWTRDRVLDQPVPSPRDNLVVNLFFLVMVFMFPLTVVRVCTWSNRLISALFWWAEGKGTWKESFYLHRSFRGS